MIDFRYHLVSLVAVFMALAVGIVLGAGPLGQEISSTLEAQVRDLREERNGLRDQLDQAQARGDLKDQVVEVVTPTVTADQLTGHRVALVAMPGADRNLLAELQDVISGAGGVVAVTARLDNAWTDPDLERSAERHELAAQLATDLAVPTPRTGDEPTVETVLAAAVTGQDAVAGSGAWRTAMDELGAAGLLDASWGVGQDAVTTGPPDSVVIVTGSLSSAEVEAGEDGEARLEQALDLVAGFGDLGAPTLVAGYGTEAYAAPVQAAESPVVRGVRAEAELADVVSSVDNIEGPSGQLAAVLALRWAIEDQPGHWGLGTDAVAPMPAVPQPKVEADASTTGPGPLPVIEPTDPAEGEDGAGETGTLGPVDSSPTGATPTGESSAAGTGGAPTTDAVPTTGAPTP